jgi:two-component system response regulator DevR
MDASEPVTVYLVDDHQLVRDGLRYLVEGAGMVVAGEAATADEAIAGILATRPRVATIDVRLADGSGIEVCKAVTQFAPETACLMLTGCDDDESLFSAIAAGASGYLLKQIRNVDLVNVITRTANGEHLLDSKATATVLDRIRFGPHCDPLLKDLTVSERRVLTLLGEGLSNRQIGQRMLVTEHTVKNNMTHVLHKLGMQSRTQAALYFSVHGLPAFGG